jgi:hypothetical protein
MSCERMLLCVCLALAGAGCQPAAVWNDEHCDNADAVVATTQALSSIDCAESQDTGYSAGKPFPITVVTADGKKVERETARAYYVMAQAADRDGVQIQIVSAFRTMAEQERLYACYVDCNCNNCNLAAEPGHSNHQSGHALDLNTSATGVLAWLNAHAASFGFEPTVPSEDWHWEWWGGGPGGGPCGIEYAGKSLGLSGQSYPIASRGPVTIAVGETVSGWVKLENVGTATWKAGVVRLAPIPRDQASAFASPSWLSPTRISTASRDVPMGEVGEFPLDITGRVEGQSILSLGWVAEGLTWFANGPRGGGPEDGYFAVAVNVVAATSPQNPPTVPDAASPDAAPPNVPRSDAGSITAADSGLRSDQRDAAGPTSDASSFETDAGDAANASAPRTQAAGCRAVPGRTSSAWLVAVGVACLLVRRRRLGCRR